MPEMAALWSETFFTSVLDIIYAFAFVEMTGNDIIGILSFLTLSGVVWLVLISTTSCKGEEDQSKGGDD